MSADETADGLRRAVPWLWLALSALWAAVIIVTDLAAWTLALWIATTLGPLTYLQRSSRLSGPSPRETGMAEVSRED